MIFYCSIKEYNVNSGVIYGLGLSLKLKIFSLRLKLILKLSNETPLDFLCVLDDSMIFYGV